MPRYIAESELLSENNIRIVDLVRVQLPSYTILATNFESELVDNSYDGSTNETYAIGTGYISHGAIALSAQTDSQQVNLIFDAIDNGANTVVNLFANGNYSGAPVMISKKIVYLDSAGFATSGTTFNVFKGIVDNYTIKVNDKEANLFVNCSGPFADFDKTALYGYTNTSSQSRLYPNDIGFKYSTSTITNIRWEE